MEPKTDQDQYYLDLADTSLKWSNCIRRKFGAVIVNDDRVIATGYNGAPCGRKGCSDLGYCFRERNHIPSGERYELCRSVHAEANAIINAPKHLMIGATMYLAGRDAATNEPLDHVTSCSMCRRFIINSGITKLITRNRKGELQIIEVKDWVENDDSIRGDNPMAKTPEEKYRNSGW